MGWSFGKILILSFEDDEEDIINQILSYINEKMEVLKQGAAQKKELNFEGLHMDKHRRIVAREENVIELI